MEIHDLDAAVEKGPRDDQSRNNLTTTGLPQSSSRNPVAEHEYSAPLDEVIATEVGR
jgi:hypothetical protein